MIFINMSCSIHNTKLTKMVSNLKSLGRTYSNEEMAKKILRCLPRAKWWSNRTSDEEARNLKLFNLVIRRRGCSLMISNSKKNWIIYLKQPLWSYQVGQFQYEYPIKLKMKPSLCFLGNSKSSLRKRTLMTRNSP